MTVGGPVMTMRMPAELTRAIDNWRRQQEKLPNRSDAIRRLVQQALEAAE